MGRWISVVLASTALAMAALPAEAAWKSYVNKQLGVSFTAPGDVKAGVGNSRAELAGPRQTIVYRSAEDNVEYRVIVLSFRQAQAEGASLLGERQVTFQQGKKLVSDTFTRTGSDKDTVYGRKIVVDLPDNKGRTTGAFYFTNGRLFQFEATVLPGNLASPDPDRFLNSIKFGPLRNEPGAVELETPEIE